MTERFPFDGGAQLEPQLPDVCAGVTNDYRKGAEYRLDRCIRQTEVMRIHESEVSYLLFGSKGAPSAGTIK